MLVVENDDHIDVAVPEECVVIEPLKISGRSSLIVLNQAIESDIHKLWEDTEVHVCADGGANRLYEYSQGQLVPDYIVGDLDSLTPEVGEFYKLKGAVIIPQYSQYATDFTKSVYVVLAYFHDKTLLEQEINNNDGLEEIAGLVPHDICFDSYILNGLGGRFDQTIHSVNQILMLNQTYPSLTIYFITKDDVVFLLHPGTNYISYLSKAIFAANNPTCGLLPLNGPTTLTTRGLKWDVTNWDSHMGGNVSSSNALVGNKGVIVVSSNLLIVNIELSR